MRVDARIAAGAIVTGLAGCAAPHVGAQVPRVAGPRPPLELRLDVPATVPIGRPVTVRLVVANVSGDSVHVNLGGRPTTYDVLVARTPDGPAVWSRLHGVATYDVLTGGGPPLAPGDSLVYAATWDQITSRGAPVAPGTYYVRGWVAAYTAGQPAPAPPTPRGVAAAAVPLTIIVPGGEPPR